MSGIEDPGPPPELPEEYADIYRDAYLRALEEIPSVEHVRAPEPVLIDHDTDLPPPPDGSGRIWLIIALVALLLIIAAYVAGDLLSDEEPQPTGTGTEPAATTTPASASTRTSRAGTVWAGTVAPVTVESAEATCTSPDSVDAANQPVSYAADNAVDTDESTAWRCNGRARGETLTFTLPADTEVAELGLVPGYAKTDPNSGTDRYAENNRITKVRWTLADGMVLDQVLDPDPGNRTLQTIRVPRTTTGEVVLEIRAVQRGVRNTTAISTVLIAAAT